jgi:hypothetical protein
MRSETDTWHCVQIREGPTSIGQSIALMNALARKARSVKLPEDATAHHVRGEGIHLYYLSPSLATIAFDVLEQHAALPLSKEPDLTFARRVDLTG